MKTKTLTATLFTAALGTALVGLAAGSVAAQSETPAAKPITIKLGVFLPSGSGLKDAVGKTWFSVGAEYDVPQSAGKSAAAQSSLTPLGYIDYAQNSKNGLRADYLGIGPGVRYTLAAPGTGTLIPYVGAGIGAYFLHASGLGGSSNKTDFGYRLNAGVEFSQSYLFEINYTDPGSLSGTQFSGFNIQVGAKF